MKSRALSAFTPPLVTYNYDFENRLTEVVNNPNGSVVRFTYDPFGRKLSRTVQDGATITTYFLYDGAHLIAELDEQENELRSYLFGPRTDELLIQREGNQVYYALHDHQFTVTGLTDENGGVIQSYTYDAFGNSTDNIQQRITPFGYTGRYIEKEIDLYDYRNRFYDPELGRFLTPDPALFIDGPNLYTYVTNNPSNFTDPYGLCLDCNDEPPSDAEKARRKLEYKMKLAKQRAQRRSKLGSERIPIPWLQPGKFPMRQIEKYLPTMHEFAVVHDKIFDALPRIPGEVPIVLQPTNIPTMPPAYLGGVAVTAYNWTIKVLKALR